MKSCVLILPYFGNFNNYFKLFLNSVKNNKDFIDLLLITDNIIDNLPENVILKNMKLEDFKTLAQNKMKINVSLSSPYKLCDFKPSYGFLFKELIKDYKYWGYCDCDLILGNMSHFLQPLFEKNYDKIFAAGHLTLYLNNDENNTLFMKKYNECFPYVEAYSKEGIYVFDEDYVRQQNNIHSMFLDNNKKVYSNDLSANISTKYHKLVIESYLPETRGFEVVDLIEKQFYYSNGAIVCLQLANDRIISKEFLYIHLQMRKMRIKGIKSNYDEFQICPDRFILGRSAPYDARKFKKQKAHVWLRPYDVLLKKIKRRLCK